MSKVVEFPIIPLWYPNLNLEEISEYVLNKKNIKEWMSYFQNEMIPLETEIDGLSDEEFFDRKIYEANVWKFSYRNRSLSVLFVAILNAELLVVEHQKLSHYLPPISRRLLFS